MAEGDRVTAYEIFLVESNDGDLYKRHTEPIIHNYAKKMKAGTYDHELGLKGVENLLVPDALYRYKRSDSGGDIGNVSKAQKHYIAEQWIPSIEEQARYEAFGHN
jgi:hypothetical protein